MVGGFDPRRFVEDLLARVRDLLVLTLAGDRAESVLSDTAEAEDMDDLHRQAKALGLGALTAMADIINTTLGAMTGAISPRMRLELLAARLLAGSESGFATAAPAPASSGMPPAAASSTFDYVSRFRYGCQWFCRRIAGRVCRSLTWRILRCCTQPASSRASEHRFP